MMDLFKGALSKGVSRVFGTKSDRDLKKLSPLVEQVFHEVEKLESLSDDELRAKTDEFRARLSANVPIDDLVHEAFAVVMEACKRNVGNKWVVRDKMIEWDMVPFHCQLVGGLVLYQGKIAEMATGEGKTLVAIFPLYVYGLTQRGAHLVTVNDYLAQRDAEWVGQILRWLGLTVSVIVHGMTNEQRRTAYGADVTYGTNNEFGFDYLRDNMVVRAEDKVQRPHYFAIVDEVDSVLIDEARTPLIISGPVAHAKQHYDQLRGPVESLIKQQNQIVSRFMDEGERLIQSTDRDEQYQGYVRLLQVQRGAPKHKRFIKLMSENETMKKRLLQVEGDFMREKRVHVLDDDILFSMEEKGSTVTIADKGREVLSPNDPDYFTLPDIAESLGRIDEDPALSGKEKVEKKEEIHRAYGEKSEVLGTVHQLLKAYALFERDKEYIVQEGKVVIVDEHTGRLMPGRRFSDGLHQALEAKERVAVGQENQTLATITIQNYFRMYEKLAGMTGTAETEAGEFWDIYKLDVVVIPTNLPIARDDMNDLVYKTKREKYNAIMEEIDAMRAKGRPVLVGTISVDVSETISRMLKRRGVQHEVLNAKNHQREAEIVSLAGQPGAITIATNMAGRGTDIKLAPEVVDGEIRETSGKQDKSGLSGGLHIIGTERHESRRIDRQLRGRSGRQGDPGSSLFFLSLEDNLMRLFAPERIAGMMDKLGAEEGEVITHPFMTRAIEQAQKKVEGHNFSIRKHLLQYDDVMNQQREVIYSLRNDALDKGDMKDQMMEMLDGTVEQILLKHCNPEVHADEWDLDQLQGEMQMFLLAPVERDQITGITHVELREKLLEITHETYARREEIFTPEGMREIERRVLLAVIDDKWRDHLYEVDQLKAGIGLRAYAQKDPLIEYKHEAFTMFEELMEELERETSRYLFRVMPARQQPARSAARPASAGGARGAEAAAAGGAGANGDAGGGEEQLEPVLPGGMGATQVVAARENKAQVDALGGSASAGGSSSREEEAAGVPQRPVKQETFVRTQPKVGRNDPCPCGSGKKYKKCCGVND